MQESAARTKEEDMIGAIIGDIAGSRFEFNNIKTKDFELFVPGLCEPTDDSIMTLAVAKAIVVYRKVFEEMRYTDFLGDLTVQSMQELGRRYPDSGYGVRFGRWLYSDDPQPYNSWGNGAAMRVSPCGWAANSVEEAAALSRAVTAVTHNHPEGLKGAEAVATSIMLLRQGKTKSQIESYINDKYYRIDFTLDEIRPGFPFDESCQGTVPQAFEAFFEAENFEDTIRNAISLGGDSDTIAAIAGSVAEACWDVPEDIRNAAMGYLDDDLKNILTEFEEAMVVD